jgi:hypothetical protein
MVALLEALTVAGSMALVNAARRATLSIVGLVLCALLFFASLGFFTVAAYLALEQAIGAIRAPLAVGGTYLILALAGLLVLQARR